MKKRYLVALFFAAFIVGVIVNVPVGLLVKDGNFGSVKLYGVSGTLWQGQADLVRVDNNHDISMVEWSLNPIYLLLGQLNADIGFTYLEGRGKGNIAASASKTVSLSEVEFSIEADKLTQKFANGFVGLEGDAVIQIDSLEYKVGEVFVSGVSGYLGWSKSGVAYPISGTFGNLSVLLSQDEQSGLITADVSNKAGEVSLSGNATLNPGLQYNVDILIKLRDNASEAMRDNLGGFLQANRNGEYVLKRTGKLL